MATVAAKTPVFKLPKDLAACADMLYTIKQERFAANKVVDGLKAKEAMLVEHLIDNLPKSQATGVAGKIARATITTAEIATVTDWEALYGYILKNAKKNPGVWGLMQRRLNDAPAREIMDSGAELPGVSTAEIKKVSLNKVG